MASSLAAGYGGTMMDLDAAQSLGGKRTLFGRGKINDYIREQNRRNDLLTEIAQENKISRQNQFGNLVAEQNSSIYNGWKPGLILAGKGTKIPELEDARN